MKNKFSKSNIWSLNETKKMIFVWKMKIVEEVKPFNLGSLLVDMEGCNEARAQQAWKAERISEENKKKLEHFSIQL